MLKLLLINYVTIVLIYHCISNYIVKLINSGILFTIKSLIISFLDNIYVSYSK